MTYMQLPWFNLTSCPGEMPSENNWKTNEKSCFGTEIPWNMMKYVTRSIMFIHLPCVSTGSQVFPCGICKQKIVRLSRSRCGTRYWCARSLVWSSLVGENGGTVGKQLREFIQQVATVLRIVENDSSEPFDPSTKAKGHCEHERYRVN